MGTVTALPNARSQPFWDDMGASEHMVQIYGTHGAFLAALEGFVASALRDGESAIVIASAVHLHALEKRLRDAGHDVEAARAEHRYQGLLAEEILARVLVDRWPEEKPFLEVVAGLAALARGEDRRVRAFSEMSSVLWSRADYAATIQLELLWSKACDREKVPLFCAYSRKGFTRHGTESIVEICRLHARVVP
jgi:hypothetical protein